MAIAAAIVPVAGIAAFLAVEVSARATRAAAVPSDTALAETHLA
jgi:hypothetical protein